MEENMRNFHTVNTTLNYSKFTYFHRKQNFVKSTIEFKCYFHGILAKKRQARGNFRNFYAVLAEP